MYATLPDYNSALPLPRMVNIPPGRFLMGGLDERDDVEGGCTLNERPPHYVYIAAFALGRYPSPLKNTMRFARQTASHSPTTKAGDAASIR